MPVAHNAPTGITAMYTMAYVLLIIFAVLLFLLRKIGVAERKGRRGELRVKMILRRLPKDEFIPLSDIMIRKADGGTSQIDHVVLSEYGIFVIETKNYKGWIFGRESSEQWVQVIYGHKYPFRNPVKQNLGHIYALKSLLSSRFPGIKYFPIVVFAGSAALKDIEASVPVIHENNLIRTIEDFCAGSVKKCLSLEQVAQIKEELEAASIDDRSSRKVHNERIRDRVIEDVLKMQTLTCPKCNGRLVLRQGKHGNFYGCENYPKCKFTMKG